MLDQAALHELAADDLVTLGAHTRHHWILSRLPEEEQVSEIAGSADDLERWAGERPRCFAYPNGKPADFAPESGTTLGRLGFTSALTTIDGECGHEHAWWRLPRIGMDASGGRRIR
jgi:peptidoglycan/xylan/chitin deacetylase (PgdA/CDA1 family)